MPAITCSTQHPLLPDPVIQELLVGDENRFRHKQLWSISICVYPDVVVIDGWQDLCSWITGLKFSEVVTREGPAVYRALLACTEALYVLPKWPALLKKLGQVDAALASDIRARVEREGDGKKPGLIAAARTPQEEADLILEGFRLCAPPTDAATADARFQWFLTLKTALANHIKAHGRAPEGEFVLSGRGYSTLIVDCAVLRAAGVAGKAGPGVGRGVYRRIEPAVFTTQRRVGR